MGAPSKQLMANIMEGTPQDVIDVYAGLVEASKQKNFGEYETNVVIIDTETTGVSYKRDELTQIAAARLVNGEPADWFVTFVNPGMPIPEEITHLTNISDDDVKDAPTPEEALEQLVEFVGDAKLVAHNAAFDRHFVTEHVEGYPLLENEWIDSLELSRIALPRMKSHRLIDLVKAFGAPLSTHRADEDVLATCALYRILLAAVDALPNALLQTIASFVNETVWPFGRIFQAFAARKHAEYESSVLTEDERAMGRAMLPVPFSLAECRMRRVQEIKPVKRKDAATLFPPKMLERLRESGATVRTENGEEPAVMVFPSIYDIEDAFSAEGNMGRIYDDYEARAEQLEMAIAVRDAFENSVNLMVEAGTGTGKSMAYLVPCVEMALRNDITVGIATKTNALLDQLVYKELPALSQAMEGCAGASAAANGGESDAVVGDVDDASTRAVADGDAGAANRKLAYVPLKGFTHYPCLYRINRILRQGPGFRSFGGEELSQAPSLAALLSFIQQTEYDDMDSLKIDYRALPRQAITTNSGDCLRRRCPFYGAECFVHGQRMRAENADIVVTNHSLLFYDTAADGSLLPPIRYWVVDEAHGAEDEARRALSMDVSVEALSRLTKRASSDDPAQNVFLAAARKADLPEVGEYSHDESGNATSNDSNEPGVLFHGLIRKAGKQARLFDDAQREFSSQALTLLEFDTQRKSSYETFDLWINQGVRNSVQFKTLETYAKEMIEQGEKLVTVAQEIVAIMDDFKGVGFAQREIASLALELKELMVASNSIFLNPSEAYVYSVTLNRREGKGARVNKADANHTVFHSQLYNVGQELDETLYQNTRSIVFTSATLTVNDSFTAFSEAMGLNTSEQSQAEALVLSPCFDFDNNMKVLVISDIPEPNEDGYLEGLQEFLRNAHIAQSGSMLTLFTNRKELDKCFSAVEPYLKERGLHLVSQRKGTSIKGLRDEFLADEALSMFALKSFWEGFDAPGATLRGVVIPKLPFSKPSDPLSLERKNRDDAAWRRFDLPRAVIDVRQAAGRLIRKADDSGAFILCDTRLLSKSYGKAFVNSLPSKNVQVVTMEEAYKILQGL